MWLINTQQKRISNIARWLAIPVVAFVLNYAVSAFSFFAFLVASPFPDLFPYFTSFILTFTLVTVIALLAPMHKRYFAIATLFLTSLEIYYVSSRIGQFPGDPKITLIVATTVLGGIMPLALTFYLTSSVRRAAITKTIGVICAVIFAAFAGTFYLNFVDYFAKPDPLPEHSVLRNHKVSNYHEHRLGGFIDQTKLQRFDVTENNLRSIVSTMRLTETSDVPKDFFIYSPYWWPDKVPAHYLAFKSPEFSFDTRPGDGTYYFLLYDQDQKRTYVWVDENF